MRKISEKNSKLTFSWSSWKFSFFKPMKSVKNYAIIFFSAEPVQLNNNKVHKSNIQDILLKLIKLYKRDMILLFAF